MENHYYRPRICDDLLQRSLRTSGAVLVSGPRRCGKTSTAEHAAESALFLQDPERRAGCLRMAQTQPSFLLKGAKPRLIDEWQDALILWDAVRFAVDQTPGMGQFILTGSVSPDWDKEFMAGKGGSGADESQKIRHTGTGRIAEMMMRPMSLRESGESDGTVSLKRLFDGQSDVAAESRITLEDLAYAICRGGWPESLDIERSSALESVRDYADALCRRDLSAADGSRKNPDRAGAILRSLGRHISSMTSDRSIMQDVSASGISLTDKTLEVYLSALRRLFIVEDVKAWQPPLRSSTKIRSSAKRQLCDPSIAAAALGMGPEDILNDFEHFGYLFESLCARDLRVYSEPLRGTVRHYSDSRGLKADLIVTLGDGRWAAADARLGSEETEEGARDLVRLAGDIDTERLRAPSFLMVITGGGFAYRRRDGVFVVPAGCLKD